MKCRKYIFCLATVLIFNTEIFAQESDSEQEQIALPEVTTVISTSKLSVEPDALPDFENVVDIEKGSGDIQPVLPEESSVSILAVQKLNCSYIDNCSIFIL